MLKSGLFLRTLSLVMFAILLSAVLIMAIFVPLSSNQIASIRATELEVKANYLAEEYAKYCLGLQTHESFRIRVGNNNAWGAQAFVFTGAGALDVYTITSDTAEGSEEREAVMEAAQQLAASYTNHVSSILATGEPITIIDRSASSIGNLLVGVPVNVYGITLGAVFLVKPMAEINTSVSDIVISLLLSMLVVLLLMFIPSYYTSRHLIRPINQMRDVALAMASGNFNVQADASHRSEIGQLGGALNYMSQQLSKSINDLTIERNRLERILNGLSEGILAVDGNGCITHTNPALRSMFPTLSDRRIQDRQQLIPDVAFWQDVDVCMKESQPMLRTLTIGKAIYSVNLSPLEGNSGSNAGVVALFHDVTESERLEQTRRDYVANVSHELRTPVAAVRGLAEALSDGIVTDDNRQRYYNHILRETMRLSRLINDLLELSRLQSGSVALEKHSFDLRDLITAFVECYGPRADAVDIQLLADVPEQLPRVFSNADRVDQVLVVLFDNALKFTEEGGTITLRVEAMSDHALVTLTDTGCGIAKDDVAHVFDRFYKADTAHSGSGTGLGLSIAREIMQLMGETITVESEEGKGTAFSFTLHYPKADEIQALSE